MGVIATLLMTTFLAGVVGTGLAIKALEDQATPALVDLRVMKDLMWVTVFDYFAGLAKTKRKRVSCTAGGFFTN